MAQLKNGTTHIEVRSLAEAKVLEITENIGRRELNALDRAQHLFDLKQAYEELHPKAKWGGNHGNQHTGGKVRQTVIIAFSQDAAETLGLSDRAIRMSVAMWTGLSDASKAMARGTWLADHQAGLMQLAKQSPTLQEKALALIFPKDGKQSKPTNVADTLFFLEFGTGLSSKEKKFLGIKRSLKSLQDHEFDEIIIAQKRNHQTDDR